MAINVACYPSNYLIGIFWTNIFFHFHLQPSIFEKEAKLIPRDFQLYQELLNTLIRYWNPFADRFQCKLRGKKTISWSLPFQLQWSDESLIHSNGSPSFLKKNIKKEILKKLSMKGYYSRTLQIMRLMLHS